MLALLSGISIAMLPQILLWLLIIVVFCAILWFVLSKMPEPIASWARWIVIVIGGIILLWFLISLAGGGGMPIHN